MLWVGQRGGTFRTPNLQVNILRGLLVAVGALMIVYSTKYVQVDLALTVLISAQVWSNLLARFRQRTDQWTHLGGDGTWFSRNPDYTEFGRVRAQPWVIVKLIPSV